MGTMIQTYGLGEREYRGERFADWPRELRGHSDLLTLTQPDIIRAIHSAYLEAGADIIETNSFTSNSTSLADYGMEELVYELNHAAARLARGAADEWERRTPDAPRFVAGDPVPGGDRQGVAGVVIEPGQDLGAGATGERVMGEVGLPALVRLLSLEPDVGGLRPLGWLGDHQAGPGQVPADRGR